MSAAVNNKDEGNHPSSGLPVHLIQVAGETGTEHTLPVTFPSDVREGKRQKKWTEKKTLDEVSGYLSFPEGGGLDSSYSPEGEDSGQ